MWSTIGIFASLLVGVLGIHFGYILCNDHLAAFLMSLVLARWTYLGFGDLQSLLDEEIDTPQPKSYEISELDAMAAIRETLTYTSLGDRWWHIRDLNLDDGRLLAAVNFEDEHGRFSDMHFSKERIIAKTQIVLIVEVSRSTSKHVSVRLRFVVTSTYGRKLATSVIKSMQQALDEALEKRAAKEKPIQQEVTA
jgi:hypothetical protein